MTDQNSPSVASDTTQVRTAQRFGEDWEKEIMRLNKKDIVLMLKNQIYKNELLREALKALEYVGYQDIYIDYNFVANVKQKIKDLLKDG